MPELEEPEEPELERWACKAMQQQNDGDDGIMIDSDRSWFHPPKMKDQLVSMSLAPRKSKLNFHITPKHAQW